MKIDVITIENHPSGEIIQVYVEQCCAFCDNITDDWTVWKSLGQNFNNEIDEDNDCY